MNEDGVTRVADLLPERTDLAAAMERQMRSDPLFRAGALAWDFIGEEAGKALRGLLEMNPFELLAQGWIKAKAVRDYADPAKLSPGETAIVYLAEHRIRKELAPLLEVTVRPCPPVPLRFTVALTATLRGVALSIRDGHIIALCAGDATIGAQLSLGPVKLTDEKKSKPMKLPGRHAFTEPGWEIPRAQG